MISIECGKENEKICSQSIRTLVFDESHQLRKNFLSVIGEFSKINYVKNVHDVLNQMTVNNVHLIILTDIHGMEITCRIIETIRILKKVPILVISSIKKEERTTYIESGADMVAERDYSEEDMKLQLFALMRRYLEWEKDNDKKEDILQIGSLIMNFSMRKVLWKGQEVKFTRHEFDFLYFLASSPERVYTFNQIYQVVWKDYPQGDIVNMIRCMVGRIKKKLKAIDSDMPDIIHNVRNIGYHFKMNKIYE